MAKWTRQRLKGASHGWVDRTNLAYSALRNTTIDWLLWFDLIDWFDLIWFDWLIDLIWFDLIDWLIEWLSDWLMHCNLPVQAPSGQDFLPHALPRILEPDRTNMFVLRYLIYLHYLALLWRFLRGPIFRCSCIPFFAGPSRRCEEYGWRFRASASGNPNFGPKAVTATDAPLRQRVEKCGRKSETTLYGCQDNAIVETPIQGW